MSMNYYADCSISVFRLHAGKISLYYPSSDNVDLLTLVIWILYSDNDTMIGNKNRIKGERLQASKNHTVLQNRHALCKVKSSNITENPPNMRKCNETAEKSSNITDPVQKGRPTKSASNQKTFLGNGRSSSIGL